MGDRLDIESTESWLDLIKSVFFIMGLEISTVKENHNQNIKY